MLGSQLGSNVVSIGSTGSALLSVAGCGRLLLGTAHWATSIALLQVVDN